MKEIIKAYYAYLKESKKYEKENQLIFKKDCVIVKIMESDGSHHIVDFDYTCIQMVEIKPICKLVSAGKDILGTVMGSSYQRLRFYMDLYIYFRQYKLFFESAN